MTPFMSLLKISLLNFFGLTAIKVRYLKQKQRLWEPLLIGFGALAGGASFGSAFYFLSKSLTAGPQPDIALTLPILVTQILALVLGMFSLISIFYFSSDLDLLVPLPLKERHILAAKFLTVNITEYLPALVVFVPALIAYNQIIALSAIGWISAFLVLLILPVIPLALMGMVSVTMMRGLNRKHRDIMIVIASLVLVSGILYFQYTMQSALMKQVDIEAVIQNRVDFVFLLGSFFPPSIWATRAISRAGTVEGLANLGYLITSSLAAVVAFLFVGQRYFYGGLVGGGEKDRKGVLFNNRVIAKQAVQTTIFNTLFAREWRLFIRVPIWLMNGFLSVVLIPLLMFFPAMTAGKSVPELASMIQFAPNGLLLATLVVAGLIGMLGGLNTLASTSISREGKQLWISRSIPVTPLQQVLAKLAHAAVGSLVAAVPVLATFALVVVPGAKYVLAALLLGLVFGAAPQILGLLFDLYRPLLNWTNPQHAVKNNLNAVLPLLLIAGFGAATYFIALSPLLSLGYSDLVIWTILLISHLLIAAGALGTLVKWAPKLYEELEHKL